MGRKNSSLIKGKFKQTVSLISLTVFAFLFFVPLCIVLSRASFNGLKEIFRSKYFLHIISFSLKESVVSAFFSLVWGMILAFIMSNIDFKWKKQIRTIMKIPFILPAILVVLGFVIFYGNNGMLSKILHHEVHILYSFKAVILAHVFYNFPVVSTILTDAIISLDSTIEDHARVSGANEVQILFHITLPRIKNALLSAFMLVFLLCFTSFAIILILGGGPALTTAEVEIYRLTKISLDFEKACCLSYFSIFICIAALYLENMFENKTVSEEYRKHIEAKIKIPASVRIYGKIFVWFSLLFVLLPILSVVYRAFGFGNTNSWHNSKQFFSSEMFTCVFNSVFIGIASAFVSVFLAFGMCFKKRKILAMLPMTVSSVILGLSFYIISYNFKHFPGIILIILAHGIINLPFAFKTISHAFNGLSDELKKWAVLCGCTDFEYFKEVELPLVKNSVITAILFCFSLSCGELNASIILGNSKVQTIPMMISNMIASYNFRGACVLGTVLIFICLVIFYIGEKLKDSDF